MFKSLTKKLLALSAAFLLLVTSCTTQVNPADLELRVSDNFLQYRVSETASWTNVLSLNDIRGTNGTNGTNGVNGVNGLGITSMSINAAGELVVVLSNGTTQNLGRVVGAQGPAGVSGGGGSGAPGADGADGSPGADGVGISTAEINSDGDLVITLTNNQQINVGSVTPPAAPNVIIAKGSYFVDGSLEDVLFYYYEGEGYAGIPEFDFVEDLVDPTNPLHVEYLVEELSPSRRITDLDDIKGLTPRILVIKDVENPYGIEEDEFGVYWTYATDEEILLDESDPDSNLLNLVVLMSDLKGEKGQSGARFITLSNGIQILTNPSYEIPDFYETGTSGNESNFTRIFYGYELHMLEKGKYSKAGSYRLVRDLDLSSFEGAAFIEVSKAESWKQVDQIIGSSVTDKFVKIVGTINDVYEFEALVNVENVVAPAYNSPQARQNEISNRVVTALNSNREFSAHAIASIRNGFVVLMTRDVGAGTIIEAEFANGGNQITPTFSGSATDFELVSTPGTYSSFSKFELVQDNIELFSALDAMRVGAFSVLNSQEIALFKIEYEDANGDPGFVDFEVDAYFDEQITDIDSLYTFMTSAMASNPNVSITRIDGVFSFELIGALAGLEVTDLLNTADFIGFVELLFTLDSTDEDDFTFDYSQDVDNSTTNPLEITSVSVFNTQVLETLPAEKALEQLFNLARDAVDSPSILNLFNLKMDFDGSNTTTTDFYPIKLYVAKTDIVDNADTNPPYNDNFAEMLKLFGNSTTNGTEGVFVTAYDMFNALVFKAISDNSLSDLTNVKVLTVVLNDDTTEVDIYHNLTEFFGGVKTGLPSDGGGSNFAPSASVANFLGDLLQDTLNFNFSYDAASGQFTLVSKTPETAASNILKIKDADIPGLTKFLFNEDSNTNVTDDDGAAAGMQVLSLSFDDKYFVSSSLEANKQLTIALPSVVKDNPSLSTTRTIGIINGTDSTIIASSLFGSLALYAHTVYNDATTAQNNATAAIRTVDLRTFAKSLEVTFEEVMIFTIRNLYSQLILSLEPVFGFDNAFEFASNQAKLPDNILFNLFNPIKNLVELIGENSDFAGVSTANELLEDLVNVQDMPYNEVMEFILQTMLNHQAYVMEYISSRDLEDYTFSFYEMRQLEDLMLMEVVEDLDGFLSSWFEIEKYAASYQFYVDFEFVGGVGGLGNYIIHFTTDDHRYNDSNLSDNNFTTVDLNASRGEVVSSPALLKFIGLVPEVTSSEADTIRFDVPYDANDLEFDLALFGTNDVVSDYVTTTILEYFSLSPRDVLLDGYITQFTFEFWDNNDTPLTAGDDAVLQSFIFDINTLQAILESAEPTGTEAAATATVKHRPSPITPFTGTFDGYAGVDPVSELTLLNTLSNWKAFDLPNTIATYGLFGTLQDATVRNLVIENPMIQSESSNAEFGILAGKAINTVVHDVHIIDTLTPTSALDYESYDDMKHYPRPVGIFFDYEADDLGGLIGLSQGIVVSNVTVEVPVIGDFDDSDNVGGLIGFSSEQTIIYNSNVTSPLIVGYGDVGGFIGEYATEVGLITGAYYFIIENSFVITNFDVLDYDVGGFVGFVNNSNYFEMNIINSFAIINVVAEGDVGGFIGEIETDASDDDTLITIDNSYTIINDARNDQYLGGIYGEMDSNRFTKIYLNNVFTMIDNINSGALDYGAIAKDRDQALLIPKNVYFLNEITEDNVDEISISAISGFNRDFIGLNREQFEESFISDSSSKFLFKDLWDSSIWDFGGSGLEINAVLLDLDLPVASDITIPTLVSNPIINRALVRRSVEMLMSRELNSVVYTELETEGLSYFDITELALILPEFNQLIYGTQVVGEFLGDPITVEYDLASFESSGYRIDFEILVEDEATGAFTLTLDGTLEITLTNLAIGTHRYVFLNRSGQNAQSDPALEPAGFSDYNSDNVFIITAANANSRVGIRPIISNDGFKTMITLDHVGDLADIYTFGNDPEIPN